MAIGLQVWSVTPVSNATADTNINWAEGQAPSSVNDSARAMMASAAKWRDDNNTTLITSGSSSALTLVTNQVQSALTAGYTVEVTFGTAVDTNATLAVDGLAAAPLQLNKGTNIIAGTYSSGDSASFAYSSTGTGQWYRKSSPGKIQPADPNSPAGGAFTPTPPPAFSSVGLTMMGMGATAKFAPKVTGRCSLAWQLMESVSISGPIRAQIFYGTGTAPSSGAATSGTSAGMLSGWGQSAGFIYDLTPTAIVTGITIGTTYWVDLAIQNASGGTITSTSAQLVYQEF